jgi:phage-related minor tail protein
LYINKYRTVQEKAKSVSDKAFSEQQAKLEEVKNSLEQKRAEMNEKPIEFLPKVCPRCGKLDEFCVCENQSHLLYGSEKQEYIRDQATQKSNDKRDLPHDKPIEVLIKNTADDDEPKVETKIKNVNAGMPIGVKGSMQARKRNAVANLQDAAMDAASETETKLDDKIAKSVASTAKKMGYETFAAPSDINRYVGSKIEKKIEDVGGDFDDMW